MSRHYTGGIVSAGVVQKGLSGSPTHADACLTASGSIGSRVGEWPSVQNFHEFSATGGNLISCF